MRTFQSHSNQSKMNRLYYSYLPDGFVVAYATKGRADGEPGFLAPVLKTLNEDLKNESNNGNSFAELVKVASVLHMRDPKTLTAKLIDYKTQDGTFQTKIKVMGLLGLFNEELTDTKANK